MRTRKRNAGGIGTLLIVSMLLAACSSSSSGGDADDSKSESSGNTVEMIWPGTSDPEMQIAKDFAEEALKEDGITIDYNFMSWGDILSQMTVRIQGGNVPDATQTQDLDDLIRLGGLEGLDEKFENSDLDRDNFREGTLEYATTDGTLYSIPAVAQTWNLIINEDLLADAGWKPEQIQTWNDLETAAQDITEKTGVPGFGYALGASRFAYRLPLVAGYSNGMNIGEVTRDNEKQWREVLEHLKRLEPYRPNADVAWDSPDQFRAFANEEVAILQTGSFLTANVYEINPDIIDKTVQIPYPHGPSADVQRVPVTAIGFGLFKDAENKEDAWKVIERLTSDEWATRLAAVVNTPVSKTITQEDLRPWVEETYPDAVDAQLRQLKDQIEIIDEYGVPFEEIRGQSAMEPELQEVLVAYLADDISLDEAIDLIYNNIGEIAAANE